MTAITEGFVFGLASSVHCAAMCGPLVVAAGGGRSELFAYHGGRCAGYVAVGAALGAVGAGSGTGLLKEASPWIGFMLAFGLVLGACGLDRWLGGLPGAGRLVRSTVSRVRTWPHGCRLAILGAVTPLLPCGVLWVLFGTTLVSGSALAGGSTTLGFAAGSAPLLVAAQAHAAGLRRWLTPTRSRWLARVVFVVAAVVLVGRGLMTISGPGCCG
jgi:sulfite exporter TauE/SafE